LTRGLFGQILARIGGAFARRGRSGLIPAEEVCAVGGTVRVFTIRGIPINVHVSWLVIYGLITWTLAVGYFPRALPDLPAAAYWANGLLAAFLLFISVLLHELSHSLVAIAHGLSVRGITLHVFGGVSHLEDEPPSPRAACFSGAPRTRAIRRWRCGKPWHDSPCGTSTGPSAPRSRPRACNWSV
jgi:hypothetical protein